MSDQNLIRENALLRARVQFLEKSLGREIQWGILRTRKEQECKRTRKHFTNILEEDNLAILRQHVTATFGSHIENIALPYTLDRLVDAEILWKTLQTHPHMDAFAVVALYQKILDDWVEEFLAKQFRSFFYQNIPHLNAVIKVDEDIKRVIEKKYRLSLGRLYQILDSRKLDVKEYTYSRFLVSFLKSEEQFSFLFSSEFLLPFGNLVNSWLFSEKRHTKKISYSESREVREFMKIFFSFEKKE